jgi:hypothetical protein
LRHDYDDRNHAYNRDHDHVRDDHNHPGNDDDTGFVRRHSCERRITG